MTANINEILDLFREFVTTHDYKNTPIISVYVDVDPTNPANQSTQPAWQIELKNELKQLESQQDSEEMKRWQVQQNWAKTERMILDYLQQRNPSGRSVVLFTDTVDMIATDLQVPVNTRVYYGIPQIKHLLFALDQYKKYLAILLSGDDARLVEVFLARSAGDVKIETDHELARRFGRKSKTLAGDRRDREFERRFIREIATDINQYCLEDPECERLIFGGNQTQAHTVVNSLHPSVRDQVVAVLPMDFKLSENEIAEMIKPIGYAYEQEHDLEVVEELVARFHRNGTAIIDQEGVEKALIEGRVKTLVLPYPVETEKFDSLIVDVITNGAEVEFVYGEGGEKLKELGGIGAVLYYSAG